MSIRITARCTKCAHTYIPRRNEDDTLGLGDTGGLLVCDDCVCDYCGYGHAVQAQFDECDQDRYADVHAGRFLADLNFATYHAPVSA